MTIILNLTVSKIKCFVQKVNLPVFLCLFLTLFSIVPVFSQEANSVENEAYQPISLFFELGGNGGNNSLNIDYRFTRNFTLRGGVQVYPVFISSQDIVTLAMLNYLIGKSKHLLELGLGSTLVLNDTRLFTTLTIGYRFQKPNGGIMFRVGFTPLITFDPEIPIPFIPFGGISIGYTFKNKNQ